MTKTLILALACAALAVGNALAQPERSGEQIVKGKCINCHGTGVGGAPRIDDRAAWAPRMKQGLDATVRSAIRGHGAMPARGGMADLTDSELRAAIIYMFNPAGAGVKGAAARPVPQDTNRKIVGDMEIYLGVVPADSSGNYHLNISVRDRATQAHVKNAQVEARVASALGGTTKKLKPTTFNEAVSYVNDFRLVPNEPYTITVKVTRPKAAAVEAKFDFPR